ncbi:MAG: hypothetical protein GY854_16040 [Deltaproteobacteria bacterium]|nr:hypothetical protein [Deltaproteobacteria bacterium]
MPVELEINAGCLRWREHTIAIDFTLGISRLGEVSIDLRPLQRDSSNSSELLMLFERLKLGDGDRSVLMFSLAGRTDSGTEVWTDHAYLCDLSLGGSPVIKRATASAGEINMSFPEAAAGGSGCRVLVEYLSQGQVGWAYGPIESDLGEFQSSASPKAEEAKDKFGQITIERDMPDDLTGWLADCDALVNRVLEIVSLAQGRWLEPVARNLYVDSKQVARRLRPREMRKHQIAHLLHHLEPEPIFHLALKTYTPQLAAETGLGVALSWMLSDASYTEHRMLHFLVAFESLVSHFGAKTAGAVEKRIYRTAVRPALDSALEALVADGVIGAASAGVLKARLASTNYPTFFEKFEQLIGHYGVPVEDLRPDLREVVVKCRNDLVHRGLLAQDERGKAELHRLCDLAEELLKRIVLTILGYEGQYISPLYNLDSFLLEKDGDGIYSIRPTARGGAILARGAQLMKIFNDGGDTCMHDEFQQWRRLHPNGFVLNVKTTSKGMVHLADCSHFGRMDTGENAWGSLTKRAKICAPSLRELKTWSGYIALDVERCPDCALV